MFLEIPIENIRSIGLGTRKKLEKLRIKTVRDLLFHFPHRYEDFSAICQIADIAIGASVTVQGKILDIKNIRTWKKRMYVTEAIVEDNSGVIKAVWFNQPYLAKNIRRDTLVNLSGKVVLAQNDACFSNPAYEIIYQNTFAKEPLHTGRLVPVYPETFGLSSRFLRFIIKPLLKFTDKVPDILPEAMKKEYRLPAIKWALDQIHFPENIENAELAKKRFAFDELFVLQLFMARKRLMITRQKAPKINFYQNLAKEFVDSLPYKLTEDQRKSAWQIIRDMERPEPMNRLLEGDVGSGKTIVATLAAFMAAKNQTQIAFMAPTEILSRQHYEKNWPMLDNFGVKVALLTSSEAGLSGKPLTKAALCKKIKSSEAPIVIGTHALIQKNVEFKNLALVVIDEQHRFGVDQRAALQNNESRIKNYEKGKKPIIHDSKFMIPHLLSMSATPIPRTLGLTIWGDLDLSRLTQMPRGRKPIITKIVPRAAREETHEFIRKEIKNGRQAFVICPLINESDVLEVKSAKQEYEKLYKIFPEFKIGLLHGKLKPKEKEAVMAAFVGRKLQILVATSVIEVGIDVPNATAIVIEGADRFGLASLHQFRGRVGRGEHQSYCFLFTDSSSANTAKRLKAVSTAQNGFELAEKDLEIRGPGDFIGVRQSGLPDLAIASLSDLELIEQTRESAKKLLIKDVNLKDYPLLVQKLVEFKKRVHFE